MSFYSFGDFVSTYFFKAIDWLLGVLPSFLLGVIIAVVGWFVTNWLMKLIKAAMEKAHVEPTVLNFVLTAVNIAIKFFIIMTALSVIGFDISSILTAFAAGLVTVGLALQNSLSNLASGIIIILTKPFKIGDVIEFGGSTGTVVKIDLLNTQLETFDSRTVIVPNSSLTSANVINCTYTESRRLDLSFEISYDDSISKVKALLYTVIAENKLILEAPQSSVEVGEHRSNGVEIITRLWVKNEDYFTVKAQMQEAVKLCFDENGITIPFNQVTIHNADKN